MKTVSRSPCGERGLKYKPKVAQFNFYGSLPVRGAWIEIAQPEIYTACLSSLPVRGAWIEMLINCSIYVDFLSLPVRGAWIEISITAWERTCPIVAPRAGSVD